MVDRSDEGGDPACWAHLFEDEEEASAPASDPASGAAPEDDDEPT